jgi:hypothetical protein
MQSQVFELGTGLSRRSGEVSPDPLSNQQLGVRTGLSRLEAVVPPWLQRNRRLWSRTPHEPDPREASIKGWADVVVRAEVLILIVLESAKRESSPDYGHARTLASSCGGQPDIPADRKCADGILLDHQDGTTVDRFDKVSLQK